MPPDAHPSPGTARPGGRTARTRAAVLDAALNELGEHGYGGLTMDGVARRSGVHVATVYRRWRNVEGLVVDLMSLLGDQIVPTPDTGSLEGDLHALADGILRAYQDRRVQALVDTLVAAAARAPEAALALERFFADRNRRGSVIVERAIARGDVPADTDGVEVIAALAAPFYYRMLITRQPLDDVPARSASATALATHAGVYRHRS